MFSIYRNRKPVYFIIFITEATCWKYRQNYLKFTIVVFFTILLQIAYKQCSLDYLTDSPRDLASNFLPSRVELCFSNDLYCDVEFAVKFHVCTSLYCTGWNICIKFLNTVYPSKRLYSPSSMLHS